MRAHAPNNGSTRRLPRSGFTLVEIIVVVMILAIAAAVVVPQAIGSSDLQAVSAARTTASDIEYARDLAITTAQSVTVTFNVSGNSYTLTSGGAAIQHPITKASTYSMNFATQSGFSMAKLKTATFTGAAVTFDETGAPNNAGTVTLQAGAHLYTIDVAAATGKVSVSGS